MAHGSSVRKGALSAAIIFVLFLGMELGRAEGACNQGAILNYLGACADDVQKSGNPAIDSDCCVNLRAIHDNLKPDDACICGLLSNSLLASYGLNAEVGKAYIRACVGDIAVPAC